MVVQRSWKSLPGKATDTVDQRIAGKLEELLSSVCLECGASRIC